MEFDSLIMNTSGNNAGTTASSHIPKKSEPAPVEVSPSPVKTNDVQVQEAVVYDTKSQDTRTEGREDKTRDRNISEEEVKRIINEANTKIKPTFTEFQYKVHDKTNTLMVKIIDSKTKEIIREIPAEKTVDALAKMWELVGILVDEKR